MANIGDLVVTLDANTQGLERGMQRGRKQLDNINDGMGRTIGIAKRLTGVLGALGLGIGLGQAVRQIADFQAAMNGLAATSNATAEEMNRLEKQARELGAVSQFSAQQAAEGQRFLAQAGFEVNEILGATPGILKLAAAGGLDLASAADIASNVLGGMRLEVDQLNRVNDVLAATASRSNTNIQQLGQALSFAAPFAAGAGISIEEAAAAIGVMSDAGIQASRAGTGLVGTIRQLSKVTDTGAEVLERHGLSLADVNIEARGLGPVLDTLRGANLTTAEAIALFGSEAGAAAQVLVNDYTGGITNAAGESERMAEQLEQGLGPAFKSLGSAVSEAVLQMGDSGMAGAMEGLVRSATGVVSAWNGMSDEWAEANGVGETSQKIIEGVAQALGVLAAAAGARAAQALITLTAAKAGLTAASISLTGALTALRTVGMTLFGPIGLFVGAATLIFQFREELGLVAPQAKTVAEELDEITTSLEGMSGAMIDTQVAAFGAELVAMGVQAQKLQEDLADAQERAASPTAGAGAANRARMEASDAERALAGIESRREAISQAMAELDRFGESSAAAGEELGEAGEGAKKITDTAIAAATAVANYTAANDDATDSMSTFADSAESAARRLESVARTADPRFNIGAGGDTLEERARARFEASAFRVGDPSVINFGNSAASTSGFGTSSSAQEATGGSGRNLGSITINVKQDNGEDVSGDVQGEEAFLSRLAGALSSVSSAA